MSFLLYGSPARAHIPTIWFLGPGDAWCTFLNTAILPGDVVLLSPGDYVGPCTIEGAQTTENGEMTLIQPVDTVNRPRFVHDGSAEVILELRGESIGILDVQVGEVPAGVTGIRVDGDARFWIKFVTFEGGDGTAIDVRAGDDVRVLDDAFRGALLPVVFGCADGTCPVSALQLSGNLFEGTSGAVIHPGAWGTVADNVATGGSAPVVRYLGSGGPALIEGNLLDGGGDVLEVVALDGILRNNVLLGGVSVSGGVSLLGNSLLGSVTADDARRFEGNAVLGPLPLDGPGNVACQDLASCWEDADSWDFRPRRGGPLEDAAVASSELVLDFCGTERLNPTDAGAIEWTESVVPFRADFKRLQPCAGRLPQDTGAPSNEVAAANPATGGCGCATGAAIGRGAWILVALCWIGRPRSAAFKIRSPS